MQHVLRRRLHQHLPLIKRVGGGLVLLSAIVVLIALLKLSTTIGVTPSEVWQVLTSQSQSLKSHEGRTNVILLGIGGGDHQGGDLTDTLMVVSVHPSSRDLLLLTLPRDIWIPTLKDKINTAYHYGEAKRQGGGLILAKAAVEEVLSLPIHYAFLIDFSGFKQMIDAIGGIDVTVRESFTDTRFPVAGRENDGCDGDPEFRCRYETVNFTQGKEHMDGERALKYVRSRHAEGEVGTDFSRGQRQQAVVIALKDKLFKRETLTNWSRMRSFIRETQAAVMTDMTGGEVMVFGRVLAITRSYIRTAALTQDEPDKDKIGLLVNPPLWQYDGKWVLIPKHGDFTRIGEYVKCVLTNSPQCEALLK